MTTYSAPLTETVSNLIAQQPLFAVYMMNQMELRENSNIKTARTDGQLMEVNPEWFAAMPLPQRVFVMCHEIAHGMFDHMGRGANYAERGFGPDLKPWHHDTANDAEDYIINDMLKQARIGEMPPNGLWSPDISGYDLMDSVYTDLNAKRYDEESPDKSDGGQGESGDGDDSAPSDGDGQDDERENGFDEHVAPSKDQRKNEQEQKTALAQAAQAAEGMGKLPASLKKMIGALLDPEMSWEELLRDAIGSRMGNDSSTWQRPHRRRIAVAPHIYFPGKVGHQVGGLVIGIDISGSTDAWLQRFMSEAAGILGEIKAEWIKVICINTQVDEDQHWDIEDPEELNDLTIKCGGGTDLENLASYMADEGIDADHMIMFTDGITSYSKQSPFDCKVTWCMTTDRREPPYGQIIQIK